MARIAIVEDEDIVRRTIVRMLDKHGHDLIPLSDGAEAIDKCEREPFDLLLCDVVLPNVSGVEVFEHCRKCNPRCKAVLMSGYSASEIKERYGVPHNVLFLQKPFSKNELLMVVDTALAHG